MQQGESVTRRQALGLCLAAGTPAVTGCLDNSGSETEDPGPERALRAHLEGVDDGDVEAANAVAHPKGEMYIDDPERDDFDVTISRLQERTLEEMIAAEPEADEAQRDRIESDLEDLRAELGASEYAIVHVEGRIRQPDQRAAEQRDAHIVVVKDDGEWLVVGE